MKHTLRTVLWGVGFLLVCGLAVAVRLHHVHNETGEWEMRPTAGPALLHYRGGVYHRDGVDDGRQTGFIRHGKALGGGELYAPRSLTPPPAVQVHVNTLFYDYRLAG